MHRLSGAAQLGYLEIPEPVYASVNETVEPCTTVVESLPRNSMRDQKCGGEAWAVVVVDKLHRTGDRRALVTGTF